MSTIRFQTAALAACLLLSCRGQYVGLHGWGDATVDVGDARDLAADLDASGPEADIAGDAEDPSSDASDEPDNPCITPDAAEDVIVDAEHDALLDPDTEDVVEEDVAVDVEIDPSLDPDTEDVTDDEAPSTFSCGDVLRDGRDGQSYTTVLIGAQCWMGENLNVGTMLTLSTLQTDNGVLEKHCYEDIPANCLVYGGLYQWDEMMSYGPSDAGNPSTTRGICPLGWHVPSDEEFKVLEMHAGMTRTEADMTNGWRGVGAGTALKVGGSSGYEALMSGRFTGGMYQLLGDFEYMYTSTEYGTMAWRRCLGLTYDTVGRWNTFPKSWGLSVRCVLD